MCHIFVVIIIVIIIELPGASPHVNFPPPLQLTLLCLSEGLLGHPSLSARLEEVGVEILVSLG